jgi:hypothetical protein
LILSQRLFAGEWSSALKKVKATCCAMSRAKMSQRDALVRYHRCSTGWLFALNKRYVVIVVKYFLPIGRFEHFFVENESCRRSLPLRFFFTA